MANYLLRELAGCHVQHSYGFVVLRADRSLQSSSRPPSSRAFLVEHRKVYSVRCEADVVMTSVIRFRHRQDRLNRGLARKERHVAMLNESHQKMLQVIDERAASPDLANVPGGKTGIVTKTIKGIGNGDDFQIVEIYEVDTATIGKICDIQKLVAEELGQRVERTETVHLNRLFEKMTANELDAMD